MYLVLDFNKEKDGVDFYITNNLRSVGTYSITRYFEVIKNNKEIQENIKNKVLLYINT